MAAPPISRCPVPKLADLPEGIRSRMLEMQEKAGFIPNVFLTLAHRPGEWRAFLIYWNECANSLIIGHPEETAEIGADPKCPALNTRIES